MCNGSSSGALQPPSLGRPGWPGLLLCPLPAARPLNLTTFPKSPGGPGTAVDRGQGQILPHGFDTQPTCFGRLLCTLTHDCSRYPPPTGSSPSLSTTPILTSSTRCWPEGVTYPWICGPGSGCCKLSQPERKYHRTREEAAVEEEDTSS